MPMSWRRWWKGAGRDEPPDAEERQPSTRARARPKVWCETGQHWVRGYREGGPPIKHKPCSDDDDSVPTQQIPTRDLPKPRKPEE